MGGGGGGGVPKLITISRITSKFVIGAVGSCINRFLHSTLIIQDNYLHYYYKHNLSDLKIVGREDNTIFEAEVLVLFGDGVRHLP